MPRGVVDSDAQIDTLIVRRAEQNGADRDREALWMDSVRRYHEDRTEDFTRSWYYYHRRLARTHRSISDEHIEHANFLEKLLMERSA